LATTIRDVARAAGVSVATVSRVFNDSGPVAERTRRGIQEVARRLQSTPNLAARSLSTRRTSAVGVLLPDLYGEFFSEVIRGIDQRVQRDGYHILVSSAHNEPGEVEAGLRAMRGRVDGLILMAPDVDASTLVRNLPEHLPVVLLNARLEDPAFDSIRIDNYGGAYRMTAHLLGCGHRRVALLGGGERNHDALERRRGYEDCLRSSGGVVSADLVFSGDFTESSGYRGARALCEGREQPEAIFAANDAMAVGALSALRGLGLRVPEDVAVAGFDDIPIAEYVNPPLTTVRVSIADLGARAAGRLLEAVAAGNRHARTHETIPTELVIRGSCGAAASRVQIKEAAQ
jgi:LacI family transcriptional regulator